MDEKELVARLKKGDTIGYKYAYQHFFNLVRNYVTKNSGTIEDAHDIFQEALIVLVKQLRKPDFKLTVKAGSYVAAVAKKMWLYKLRGKKEIVSLDANESNDHILGADEIDGVEFKQVFEKKYELVQGVIKTLTSECQQVILSYYLKKESLKEIEIAMGYAKGFGKQKKKRCMDGLKKLILKHPETLLMQA